MPYVLKNGEAWYPGGFKKRDIRLEDRKITGIGENMTTGSSEEIDCSNCYVLPGIIDMHVHTGELISRLILAEDVEAASKSCLLGGVTTIGAFITETSQESISEIFSQRERKFAGLPVNVRWHLTPVTSQIDELYDLLLQGNNLKLYTTYKESGLYTSYEKIDRIMSHLNSLFSENKNKRCRILVHCEDNSIIENKRNEVEFKTPFDHTLRRPETAEIKAVETVLDLAVKHNYPVHIVHVSTPQAALLVQEAKKSAPVTCETAPHYLLLNDDMLKSRDGHRWLCTPPLRPERSRGMIVELAQDGVFDAFATDHCPFSKADKDRFSSKPENVPMGLPGTGALFQVLYEGLVKTGLIKAEELIERLTANPARILGIYPEKGLLHEGSNADIIVVRESKEKKPVRPTIGNSYNPWEKISTTLEIRNHFVNGRKIK